MALQQNRTLRSGINLPEAYITIPRVQLTYNSKSSVIQIEICKDKQSFDAGLISVESFEWGNNGEEFDQYYNLVKLSEVGVNPISQSYEYLKTVPEFSGSIDA